MTPNISEWLPKSVLCLRTYNRQKFFSDLVAGITVGLVALPLAMAFAIASGVTPQLRNLYRDYRRIPDFRAGRFDHPDWRPNRRVCRGGFGHHRALRTGWSLHVHADGWRAAGDSRRHRAGNRREIYSAPGGGGIYQRHRGA